MVWDKELPAIETVEDQICLGNLPWMKVHWHVVTSVAVVMCLALKQHDWGYLL